MPEFYLVKDIYSSSAAPMHGGDWDCLIVGDFVLCSWGPALLWVTLQAWRPPTDNPGLPPALAQLGVQHCASSFCFNFQTIFTRPFSGNVIQQCVVSKFRTPASWLKSFVIMISLWFVIIISYYIKKKKIIIWNTFLNTNLFDLLSYLRPCFCMCFLGF